MTQVSRSTTNAAKLAEQIRRFPGHHRAELEAFGAISQRVAQLAHSHPLLFFALATRHGPSDARRRAVHLAEAGHPLAEVTEVMGIPYCFRRLPPEACHASPGPDRWSADAERLFAPCLPDKGEPAHFLWLQVASYARRACDERFAAWVVREAFTRKHSFLIPVILPVAIFAWHCGQSDLSESLIITKKWSPRVSAQTALAHTMLWLRRLRTAVGLPVGGLSDPWLTARSMGEFAFTPILTLKQLLDESWAMHNCVDTYGDLLAANICRLFSVTRAGKRVATLEVRWCPTYDALTIYQLKGPSNTECPQSVHDAAQCWLALPANRLARAPNRAHLRPLDERLEPYRQATSYGEAKWATGLSVRRLQIVVRSASSVGRRAVSIQRAEARCRRAAAADPA